MAHAPRSSPSQAWPWKSTRSATVTVFGSGSSRPWAERVSITSNVGSPGTSSQVGTYHGARDSSVE